MEELTDGKDGTNPIVIGEAVDFLQALLDMLMEQHLHLEVRATCTWERI